MITLKQSLSVQGYQVQACLRRREQNHPFIALLMLAAEQHNRITPEEVHNKLLPELPQKAANNLLDQLTAQKYFEWTEYSEEYVLTELGRQSAEQQEVWTPQEGLYNFYLVDSPFVAQRVVKVAPVAKRDMQDDHPRKNKGKESPEARELPKLIKELSGQEIILGHDQWKIDGFEASAFPLSDVQAALSLSLHPEKSVSLTLKDKEKRLSYQQDLPELSYAQVRQELLFDAFADYDQQQDWIATRFEEKQLSFSRKLHLDTPRLMGKSFQAISLPEVAHQPATQQDAQQWFEALLTKELDRYFFSEEEFRDFQETLKENFQAFQPASLTRIEFLDRLANTPEAFYSRMKLQAPMLLN